MLILKKVNSNLEKDTTISFAKSQLNGNTNLLSIFFICHSFVIHLFFFFGGCFLWFSDLKEKRYQEMREKIVQDHWFTSLEDCVDLATMSWHIERLQQPEKKIKYVVDCIKFWMITHCFFSKTQYFIWLWLIFLDLISQNMFLNITETTHQHLILKF